MCQQSIIPHNPSAIQKQQVHVINVTCDKQEDEKCMFLFACFFGSHLDMFYFGATTSPVLDFWWRLLWVSKPVWILSHLHCRGKCYVHSLRSTSGATYIQPLHDEHCGVAIQDEQYFHLLMYFDYACLINISWCSTRGEQSYPWNGFHCVLYASRDLMTKASFRLACHLHQIRCVCPIFKWVLHPFCCVRPEQK